MLKLKCPCLCSDTYLLLFYEASLLCQTASFEIFYIWENNYYLPLVLLTEVINCTENSLGLDRT